MVAGGLCRRSSLPLRAVRVYSPAVLVPAAAGQPAAPAVELPGGYGQLLVTTLIVLAVVCAAAWLLLRFALRRFGPSARAAAGPIRILARAPLDARQTLFIVEAGGKTLLVGAGDRPALIAELDPDAVAAALAAAPTARPFAEVFRGLAAGKSRKETSS